MQTYAATRIQSVLTFHMSNNRSPTTPLTFISTHTFRKYVMYTILFVFDPSAKYLKVLYDYSFTFSSLIILTFYWSFHRLVEPQDKERNLGRKQSLNSLAKYNLNSQVPTSTLGKTLINPLSGKKLCQQNTTVKISQLILIPRIVFQSFLEKNTIIFKSRYQLPVITNCGYIIKVLKCVYRSLIKHRQILVRNNGKQVIK